MKFNRLIFLGVVSLLLACAAHRSGPEPADTIAILDEVTRPSDVNSRAMNPRQIERTLSIIDSLCDNNIRVSRSDDLDELQQRIERTLTLDASFIDAIPVEKQRQARVSVNELKFRTLVKAQQQLGETFKSQEQHGDYLFDKKISETLPYIQANQRYGKTKSALLLDVIDTLPQLETSAEKQRAWLAIERMVGEIDLKKSEVAYDPFQRKPEGIVIKEGKILPRLKRALAAEDDSVIAAYAAPIVGKIEKRLSQAHDQDFLDEVESSRKNSESNSTPNSPNPMRKPNPRPKIQAYSPPPTGSAAAIRRATID